ncbi:MAG: hypothetical protein CM1200mP15_07110 [Dehalococcoidia bacterium]|nr:MAG: hypothetical protein CM1200mP15_07110 [Dehalococcoidia bacterium]
MKVGFIGLGNMGNPMATNLVNAGHELVVHDLRREAATNLLEMGATWADTPKEAVPGRDVVFHIVAGAKRCRSCSIGRKWNFGRGPLLKLFIWIFLPIRLRL